MAGSKPRGSYERTPEMHENYMKARDKILDTIASVYGEEVDLLLSTHDPNYKERTYIKPIYWMDDLKEHPWRYPKLAAETPILQKRYVSMYLKWQGRVARGGQDVKSSKSRTNVWMLPEAAGVSA